MPLKPPPGFEEAFAAPCPGCGIPVGEHQSVEEHQKHLTGWLADPDRTADEMVEYAFGILAGIRHTFHIGLPGWAIEGVVASHIDQLAEVHRRRTAA